jgi:hypothetical protein
MERNNLENQIQEKLFSIEIKPSAQAWDRLDAMLTIVEEKKTKKKPFFAFGKLRIAASFLIFPIIGIAIYLRNSNPKIPTQNNQTTIVNTEIEKPIEEIQIPIIKSQILNPTQVAQTNKKSKAQYNKTVEVSIVNQNQNNPIVEVFTQTQELPQPFISQEVVVSNPKNAIAEIAIPSKKEASNAKIKVNATSLLSQVDGELEQTYRETKLEKIARNFNSVKVALANRNNE